MVFDGMDRVLSRKLDLVVLFPLKPARLKYGSVTYGRRKGSDSKL